MKSHTRIFGLITLLFFISGCSGYRTACVPDSDDWEGMDPSDQEKCSIKTGDHVRVTLMEGKQAEGKVELISSEEIVLDRNKKSRQPRGFPMDQVHSIEKISDGPSAVTAVIVGTLGLLIIGAVVVCSMDFPVTGN